MSYKFELSKEEIKYLQLLSKDYPTVQSVCTEIINLQAIMNLPKGTEHFMSDLHGEYEAFCHILRNCSGVIKEKVNMLFGSEMTEAERKEFCTLIYYPKLKLEQLGEAGVTDREWYRTNLRRLIELSKLLSSKYTRSKVRKAMPSEFSYVIDELLHAQPDEDNNQLVYHEKILETIISIDAGEDFVLALAELIKRLAVDRLHIVGDIFDRGARADSILDLLMEHYSLDIEWGNHDVLWMGAAAGSLTCIAMVVKSNIAYNNTEILESGYGISLRTLTLLGKKEFPHITDPLVAAQKAASLILFKTEGQLIKRNKDFLMEDRLLLDKINYRDYTIEIDGVTYSLKKEDFPSVNPKAPYELTAEEKEVIEELQKSFVNSERLKKHIEFLYKKGSLYKCYNSNLLFHGCIPLDEKGEFAKVTFDGKEYYGKEYMDYAERKARQAYYEGSQESLDFMWYLSCNKNSPLSGRIMKTFERTYIEDKTCHAEPENAYYKYCNSPQTCRMILKEFGLYSNMSHVINGHTPVKVKKGEKPVKAKGKLIVIDGGFCKAYQKATGIAGYTLIYNSHGMRIKSHQAFSSVEEVLKNNDDILSESEEFEIEKKRVMVRDTDDGDRIREKIADLQLLLQAYRSGMISVK